MGDVPQPEQDRAQSDLTEMLTTLGAARRELTRLMATYEFAIKEIETKVSILQGEFRLLHHYNPIEHIVSRLKTPESVLAKARKRGFGPGLDELRAGIRDVAGVRVVCSFTSDVYRVQEMLCGQSDIRLLELRHQHQHRCSIVLHQVPRSYR